MRPLTAYHKWLGIIAALPLLFMGFTGSFMLLERTFHDVISPMPHRTVTAGVAPKPIAAQIAAATSAVPESRASSYAPPRGDGYAAVVVSPPDAERGGSTILVDPQTLATVPYDDVGTAIYEKAHTLHENMFLGRTGELVIGIFGLALLTLVLAGAKIWFKPSTSWRREPFVFRRSWLRVHGATGAVSFLLLAFIATTGVLMAFPLLKNGLRAVGAAPVAPGCRVARRGDGAAAASGARGPVDVAGAIAAAQAAVPGATVLSAQFGRGPTRVSLLPAGFAAGAPAVQVTVAGGAVTCVSDVRAAGIGPFLNAWVRPLHSGQAATLVWQVIVLAGGLALMQFTITGVAMRVKRGLAPRRAPLPKRST
jgi:uncharacterized iron-regulated membrane protein